MYAIVEIGGKQYKVEKDMKINIDKISDLEEGDLAIEKVLMFVDGDNFFVGYPYLDNVRVSAKIIDKVKGKKVRGIKFKKRKNYTRTMGHRTEYLQIMINELTLI